MYPLHIIDLLHRFAAISSIVGLKYGNIIRGNNSDKKAGRAGRNGEDTLKGTSEVPNSNCFQHQVQLRMRQPGAENISIKFFKTGRLQTTGCRTREMSLKAVQVSIFELGRFSLLCSFLRDGTLFFS